MQQRNELKKKKVGKLCFYSKQIRQAVGWWRRGRWRDYCCLNILYRKVITDKCLLIVLPMYFISYYIVWRELCTFKRSSLYSLGLWDFSTSFIHLHPLSYHCPVMCQVASSSYSGYLLLLCNNIIRRLW